jgi:dTDP-4-amino-4,6-dideoxygalactose transaminase
LSELQAAVLLPQLAKLDQRNSLRRKSAQLVRTHTQSINSIQWIGGEQTDDAQPSYYKLGWLLNEKQPRDEWLMQARKLNLPLDAGFSGFVKRSARRCRRIGELPHSRAMASRLVLLHHPVLLSDGTELAILCERLQRVAMTFSRGSSQISEENPA